MGSSLPRGPGMWGAPPLPPGPSRTDQGAELAALRSRLSQAEALLREVDYVHGRVTADDLRAPEGWHERAATFLSEGESDD